MVTYLDLCRAVVPCPRSVHRLSPHAALTVSNVCPLVGPPYTPTRKIKLELLVKTQKGSPTLLIISLKIVQTRFIQLHANPQGK